MTSRDAVFIYGRLDAISVFQGWKSTLVGVIFLCFAFAKSVLGSRLSGFGSSNCLKLPGFCSPVSGLCVARKMRMVEDCASGAGLA